MIANKFSVAVIFNRTIAFDVKRFGTKQFGLVCRQTGKRLFLTCDTRFSLLCQIQARYPGAVSPRSTPDTFYINPRSVAMFTNVDFAIELLIGAGFITCRTGTATVVESFDPEKNQ
jgi:hypothetical protein